MSDELPDILGEDLGYLLGWVALAVVTTPQMGLAARGWREEAARRG